MWINFLVKKKHIVSKTERNKALSPVTFLLVPAPCLHLPWLKPSPSVRENPYGCAEIHNRNEASLSPHPEIFILCEIPAFFFWLLPLREGLYTLLLAFCALCNSTASLYLSSASFAVSWCDNGFHARCMVGRWPHVTGWWHACAPLPEQCLQAASSVLAKIYSFPGPSFFLPVLTIVTKNLRIRARRWLKLYEFLCSMEYWYCVNATETFAISWKLCLGLLVSNRDWAVPECPPRQCVLWKALPAHVQLASPISCRLRGPAWVLSYSLVLEVVLTLALLYGSYLADVLIHWAPGDREGSSHIPVLSLCVIWLPNA